MSDAHFHSEEQNYLIFKKVKTQAVGRRAIDKNYSLVKRLHTDDTNNLLIEKSPQTLIFDGNGRKPTKNITSGEITPFVTNSAKVYNTYRHWI